MDIRLFITQAVILLFCTGAIGEGDKVLLCYLRGWSVWRTGDGKFDMSHVDPTLCTHIVYSFIGVDEQTSTVNSRDAIGVKESTVTGYEGFKNIEKLVALKSLNPQLKLLVSLGGYSEGSVKYSKIFRSQDKRRTLINSIISYLREHKFDGFDLSWEYPADRGGIPQDKQNLAKFFKELKETVENEFILTLHVSGFKYNIDSGYDLKELSKYLDYINLITYWYYSAEDKLTGWNAPLTNELNEMNIKFSVDYALSKGVPKEKLLMGFATFGQTFVMNKRENDGIYFRVPANDTFQGKWSRQYGFIAYNEICTDLKNPDSTWKVKWHDDTGTPFAVNGDQLISYDDPTSFRIKLNFLASRDLAGASVYSIDNDDFKGLCGDEYPLINEIKKFFKNPPTADLEAFPPAETQVIKFGPSHKLFFCYIISWSVWRDDIGKFHAGFVDPFLCTHIIYSFVGLNNVTFAIESRDPMSDYWDEAEHSDGFGNIAHLVSLKEENPDLKILVCIGGYSEGSTGFSNMVSTKENRKTFIGNVMEYISEYKIDGVVIDWQYPGKRGGSSEDKNNFVLLLEELKGSFKSDYLLSVVLHIKGYLWDTAYDLKHISDHVDFINLATFIYEGPWDGRTGTISPLNGTLYNVEHSVQTAVKGGAHPEKLLLGFLSKGHPYLLDNEPSDGIYLGAPSSQVFKGQWTNDPGSIAFYEICWNIEREKGWHVKWNTTTSTPYATNGKKYISYDNIKSYKEKLNLIEDYDLGGAMLFTLDEDDFRGKCYGTMYPLALTIKDFLVGKKSQTSNIISSSVVSFNFNSDQSTIF